jgi:pimeloyl-ACP methyl ester carboxylesterase
MAHLARDGVKLFYDEVGSGPPMVFVHGWCCNRTHLAPQAAHFSSTHRCISLDLRGQGESDKPEQEYSIAGHADDVAWVFGELGVVRPIVVGHSMGGAIALALAVTHPELPRAIVMLDGAILWPAPLAEFAAQLAPLLWSAQYLEPLTGLVNQMFMETDDAPRRARIIAGMLSTPQHVMASEWEELRSFDSETAARACVVPALYVGSDGPVADMRRLHELSPNVMLAQTAGAGHFHQLEVPDQINAMIERFLAVAVPA